MTILPDGDAISVTDASTRGISGLIRDAAAGNNVVVERHGRPVAAVVGVEQLKKIASLEADLQSAALVLARAATDTGERSDLDDVIESLGFDRAQLESELDADLSANH